MAVNIIAKDHKDNSTVQAKANVLIPERFSAGLSHQEFEDLVAAGVPLDGFIGGVEVDISLLDEEVPDTFPKSYYTNENEEEQQKLWKDYCLYVTNEKRNESDEVTTVADKALLKIGWVGINGNRPDIVKNDELLAWCEHFGDGLDLSAILTKSVWLDKRDTDYNAYYVPEEETGIDINQDGIIKSFYSFITRNS